MAIVGADVEQLRALSSKLKGTWASQIQTVITTVDAAVRESANNVWLGPDAEQFRNVIWPEHKSHLVAAQEALVQAGDTAARNADRQSDTSATVA